VLSEIRNFIQLTDRVGTSGQPTKEQFSDLSQQGYSTVINLAMPDSDHAIPEEGNIVTGLGMSYFHIPVPFDKPTADHLKLFIELMKSLEGKKVWVHCVVNMRVSAFMYQYLRHEKGYSENDAQSPILKNWLPEMDDVWSSLIKLNKEDIGI